ncbi:MAG: tyrosine-type recombinase/integrase [Defluviitaleaceae bacterium]|nr:tyrosine-type recombinase/integrase [Defluviitaleaceae bacterium]
MAGNYQSEESKRCQERLREMQKELPAFTVSFFRAINDTTAPRTREAYAIDLKIFFRYLTEECPKFQNIDMIEMTLNDLAAINADDIEGYMEYLSLYTKERKGTTIDIQNGARGKSRKLAAVRTMFSYYFKKGVIESNPADKVDFPKLNKRTVTRLEANEVADFLDEVESGESLSERSQKFHSLTSKRDLALTTLLLGTGMRVSECVGIDISDIDFNSNSIRIIRKGGDESLLYFGKEVEEALKGYLNQRDKIAAKEGHENALFLSLQSKRITTRAVQNLVKKYAASVTPLKKISPHKLRSTYATSLYAETGDIYLVADTLGHSDINTTAKHYAKIVDDRKRQAAKHIVLRSDD